MNKKGILLIACITVFCTQLFCQLDDNGGTKNIIKELNLTAKQNMEFEIMHAEMNKEAVDIRAKIKQAKIELDKLFKKSEPKKIFIASKLNEIADLEVELRMLRIELWFDFNDQLTAEQQKVWKKVLESENRTSDKEMNKQASKERNSKKGSK